MVNSERMKSYIMTVTSPLRQTAYVVTCRVNGMLLITSDFYDLGRAKNTNDFPRLAHTKVHNLSSSKQISLLQAQHDPSRVHR